MARHLVALVVACAMLAPLVAAQGCSQGMVWDDGLGRCAFCPFGTVKFPNVDGEENATCIKARKICNSAEVAKSGSCKPCPATQVPVDDTTCANCKPGYVKTPTGVVSTAVCKYSCVPSKEICNGIDDDCDGKTDEDLAPVTCGVGLCKTTVASCLGGKPQACKPGSPRTEVCNGLDDDCDGSVDEGFISCGMGACAVTTNMCRSGKSVSCSSVTLKKPTKEVCDGIDNDCDGKWDNVPDLFCKPCNVKVPGCVGGKANTCAGACDQPCCWDCDYYEAHPAKFTYALVQECRERCIKCVRGEKCMDWASTFADKVADAACSFMYYNECSGYPTPVTNPAFQVYDMPTALQCFKGVGDNCTSQAKYYASKKKGNCYQYGNDFYGGFSGMLVCTASHYMSLVDEQIASVCGDIARGAVLEQL